MAQFEYFILLAEMRTGSNLLEENLNQFPDLICYGEAYNPHFIGYPSKDNLLGITLSEREENPGHVIKTIRTETDGLGGFRYFHDHDPRVLDACLADPACAKVVLTRNPIDSFVSWKIASATGQWKMTNVTRRKDSSVEIDPQEFEAHLGKLQGFQIDILNKMQKAGQSAFYIAYEDVQDIDVINGLAQFLGSRHTLDNLANKLKKQNPSPMSDKVENFEVVEQSLARMDRFNLNRTPNFEPRRGPMVPSYVAAANAPLMFMPIKSGPTHAVKDWLSHLADGGDLLTNFSQKSARQWKRQNKTNRTFTVVRHPVERAYDAFCQYIFHTGPEAYSELRKTLRRVHKLPLPEGDVGQDFTATDMRAAFRSFLTFVKSNLSGQTSLRTDPAWASQSHIIQGFSDFAVPDLIVRESSIESELAFLTSQVGVPYQPYYHSNAHHPFDLVYVYDSEIEALARDSYQKDYLSFGFGPLYK